MLPNPQFQIDLALNIVVMEVYSGEGQQVQSYPAERVLEAYRSGELPLPGESSGGAATQGGQAASTAQPAQQAQTPQPVQPASTPQDTVQAVAAAGGTTSPTTSGFTGDITA